VASTRWLGVELVDPDGTSLGVTEVEGAHRIPPRLHRAFSVVLHDGGGKALFQRRSLDKERWPGALANSCCGHPRGVDTLAEDAALRVWQELGIEVSGLRDVGTFTYQAHEPGGVWAEWEFDHVLVGAIDAAAPFAPDPGEVSEVVWLSAAEAVGRDDLAPWVAQVMEIARASGIG
jgi:isopentenyl-diphosphate delta-isomerase